MPALAATEGIPHVRFEVADVERDSFGAGEFDVAISRFGTTFFADPQSAFPKIAGAIRPGGRLVMMVWQSHDVNQWAVAIDRALGEGHRPIADADIDPFSLGDPATVRNLLSKAGFEAVTLADVREPVYYGRDVDAALEFVTGFTAVSQHLQQSGTRTTSVVARLHASGGP